MHLLYPRELLDDALRRMPAGLGRNQRDVLCAIVDTVFFASLTREEGQAARVAVVHHAEGARGLNGSGEAAEAALPDGLLSWSITRIAPRAFDVQTLANLSYGLEYGAQLVIVAGSSASELTIDGIARRSEHADGGDVLRIAAPRAGVVVFEQGPHEILRFEAGQEVSTPVDVLAENGPVRDAIGKITGDRGSGVRPSTTEVALRRLLQRMRATESGALLALLPSAPTPEVLANVRFRIVDTTQFMQRIMDDKRARLSWIARQSADHHQGVDARSLMQRESTRADAVNAEKALADSIDDLARLSAIDGAILAGPGLAVYGAGYIVPHRPFSPVSEATVRALDSSGSEVTQELGAYGARHTAAISFAHDTPGAVAFVVSEDGPATCALRVGDAVIVWSVRVPET